MSRVPFKDTRIDTAERSVATSSTVAADKRKLATFTKKTISRSVIRRIQPDNKDDPPWNTTADHGLPLLIVKLPTAIT